ncbi:MAG: ribosome biogenesis GTP-binding protein YihA/YsxC [Synergistaceae bacterium]|nr:ribosome biogenesis GTP-binding protein YihA/YsxC [Synergistaceae bacterium]
MTHWQHDAVRTAWSREQFPASELPEVVFVGRSNVGKSTLINVLLGRTRKKVAYVSSKPGKTRSVNFYRVRVAGGEDEGFCLVDMPGYGYAGVGADEKNNWWKLIRDFFSAGRPVAFVIHLVDFRHGFLGGDRELTDWLDGMDMPRLVVFTKGDKVPKGRAKGQYDKYVRGLVSVLPPFVTNGKNDEAAERLREAIPQIIYELSRTA